MYMCMRIPGYMCTKNCWILMLKTFCANICMSLTFLRKGSHATYSCYTVTCDRAYLHNFEIPFFSLETIVILVRIYWLSFTLLHAIITEL